MKKERTRIALKLSEDAEPEDVLAAAQQTLGRPLGQVQRVRGAGVLSFEADTVELEQLRTLPGVLDAFPDGLVFIPPRPRQEKA